MLFITLAQDDQIELIDTEEEDIEEDASRVNGGRKVKTKCFKHRSKIIKQSQKQTNSLILKVIKVKTSLLNLLRQVLHFLLLVFSYYENWRLRIDNDFILVK